MLSYINPNEVISVAIFDTHYLVRMTDKTELTISRIIINNEIDSDVELLMNIVNNGSFLAFESAYVNSKHIKNIQNCNYYYSINMTDCGKRFANELRIHRKNDVKIVEDYLDNYMLINKPKSIEEVKECQYISPTLKLALGCINVQSLIPFKTILEKKTLTKEETKECMILIDNYITNKPQKSEKMRRQMKELLNNYINTIV